MTRAVVGGRANPENVCVLWGEPDCDPDAFGCCLAYCDTTIEPNPICNADLGEECVPIYGDVAPEDGYEHVGYCSVP